MLGASGFIGRRLMLELEQRDEVEAVGSDLPSVDLTRRDETLTLASVLDRTTALVICAGIKRQRGDDLDAFERNVAMVVNLCRLLEQRPVRRVVFFSSAAVYGEEVDNTEIREDTPPVPTSFYGGAKYASERLLDRVVRRPESSLVVLRPPLVYGPGDGGPYGPSGFVRAAVEDGEIVLWGDGSELREFVYVDDVARLAAALTLHDFDGCVNLAPGRERSFRDAAEVVRALVPCRIETRERTKPKIDQAYRSPLLASLLPDVAFTPLEQGIALTHELDYASGADRLGSR